MTSASGDGSPRRAEVVMPQETCGHCAPGPPGLRELDLLVVRRPAVELEHLAKCLSKCKVALRPDVGTTERHEQVDVRTPAANAADRDQLVPRVLILEGRKTGESKAPLEDGLRQSA